MHKPSLDLSIVIPLYNEAESLSELYHRIVQTVEQTEAISSYEILFVDDGSTDGSWDIIAQMGTENTKVIGLSLSSNRGKSDAMNIGFKQAKGKVVITMDADLQDAPEEIPQLFDMIMLDGYDIVSGWKKERHDPLSKTIPTKLYNWAVRRASKINLHDFNCGLKAYRYEVVKSISVYGELHRYIPVLAKFEGYSNITEKIVQHAPRKYGTTKFGISRFYNGLLDFMTIVFLGKFSKRPMHFFGFWGLIVFLFSIFTVVGIIATKLVYLYILKEPMVIIAENPLFYIALASMLMGVQLFSVGFLAEYILQQRQKDTIAISLKHKINA